jgi:undecaprenyl diphosphate synthase
VPFVKATGVDRRHQEELLANGRIPQHIAVIMDGNGRWAKRRGLPRVAGHNEGVNSVRDIVEACAQLGVRYLTLYTFSTENWKRPKDEVSVLMRLVVKALRNERDRLHENSVCFHAIGDLSALPADVANEVQEAMSVMKENTGLNLVIALNYSGRWDILQAMKRIADDVKKGTLAQDALTEETVHQYLSTNKIPDPDLLIRTSGELRISNFLLWQLAYTEMYITDEFWPAFRRKQLYAAIAEYQRRERRFGMVSEQLHHSRKAVSA